MMLPSGSGCWVSRSMMSDQFGPVAMMVCFGAASRMAWRGRRLDARPAVGIVHLGLVHDLEEDYFGIAASVVGRQLSPQHHKPLHALVPVLHRLLVGSSGWMSIWTASPLANIASTTRSRRARKSALGPLPQWSIDCSSGTGSMLRRTLSNPSLAIR